MSEPIIFPQDDGRRITELWAQDIHVGSAVPTMSGMTPWMSPQRCATAADLRAAGYVPASELNRLRAEVAALIKRPDVEELARVLRDEVPAYNFTPTESKNVVRAVLRALGRNEAAAGSPPPKVPWDHRGWEPK